eukprot:238840-Amphidinium_carterae.1
MACLALDDACALVFNAWRHTGTREPGTMLSVPPSIYAPFVMRQVAGPAKKERVAHAWPGSVMTQRSFSLRIYRTLYHPMFHLTSVQTLPKAKWALKAK